MRQHDFASKVYNSRQWKSCRAGYIAYKQGLCERCLSKGLIVPGTEVHHRIKLTPQNITNPNICFGFDNLQLLCEQCHDEEHRKNERRYAFSADGELLMPPLSR